MSSEAPRILERRLIIGSTTKNYHHAGCTAHRTHGCRMVNSDVWSVSRHLQLLPGERSLVNVEAPHVIDWLGSSISAKHEQVWLVKYDCMTVAATWCRSDHWHNHPLSHLLAVPEIQQIQIIGGKTTSACGTTVDHHL